jgi:hypothetical protein
MIEELVLKGGGSVGGGCAAAIRTALVIKVN